ncbi:MAG: hypothetical protein ACR2LZ_08235 [Pyrinomonadaceae bacterium]
MLMRQVAYTIAFVIASFIIAPAQEEQRASKPDGSDHPCSRCKPRVVPPPGSVEYKIRIFTPRPDIDYKLRVSCMCPEGELFVAMMPPVPPPALPFPRPSALQRSEGDSFVKPPSFSYRLMRDVTGKASSAPTRRTVRPMPFMNRR